MTAWLLTWNPDKTEWDDYYEDCKEVAEKGYVSFDWSCHSKQVKIGDEFYLMKQGSLPRGIIAHGIITEDISQDEHWDEDKARAGKQVNYVTGECDTLLNYKNKDRAILDVAVLDERCPGQCWHPQASGIRIKDKVLSVLQELWRDYANNPEESTYYEVVHAENESGGTVEGVRKTVYTTKHERDPKVRRAFLEGKHLRCEVCGLDFEKVYGNLGAGYIEVHHKKPVSEGERITDPDNDLVMLCSNCHRMIHRGKDHMITVEELKEIIDANAQKEE